MIDVKSDFPIFAKHPELNYLDSAATSQKPAVVINALHDFYTNSNANVHRGIYTLSEQATVLYEEARAKVAQFIGSSNKEIIFTSGTTASLNLVALALEKILFYKDQDEGILITEMEHNSNLIPWQQLAIRTGARLDYVAITDEFRLNLKDLHQKVKGRNIKILALTHMSNTLGTINNIPEIVAFMRKNSPQTIIVLDCAQSIAHTKIDVAALGVDALAFSGHKLYGPTGIGVLYAKKYLLDSIDPVFFGGGMVGKVDRYETSWATLPAKFEAGTPPIADAIGLAAAIDYVNSIGFKNISKHEDYLSQLMISKLTEIDGLMLYGPKALHLRGGVFSFGLDGVHAHDLAQFLSEKNIAVRAGHHCNQILLRERLHTTATVRASIGLYTSETDIINFVKAVKEAKLFFNKTK